MSKKKKATPKPKVKSGRKRGPKPPVAVDPRRRRSGEVVE